MMSNPQADRLAAWLAENPDITQQDALEGLCKRFRTPEEAAIVEQVRDEGLSAGHDIEVEPFALVSIAMPGESGPAGAWVLSWVWVAAPDFSEVAEDELYTDTEEPKPSTGEEPAEDDNIDF